MYFLSSYREKNRQEGRKAEFGPAIIISGVLIEESMMSDGYYTSKKSDDVCEDLCGDQVCFSSS